MCIIIYAMGKRGRPTKPRASELGFCIQQLRDQRGWNVHQLADAAGVSYKTLSKLELNRTTPRRPEILLMKVAKALDVHPDRLLLRAPLTPMLRPTVDEVSSLPLAQPLTLLVSSDERRQLENYLQFLRYIASIEAVCRRAEAEVESLGQHPSTSEMP